MERRSTQDTAGAAVFGFIQFFFTFQTALGVQTASGMEDPLPGWLLYSGSEVLVIFTEGMLYVFKSQLPVQKIGKLEIKSLEAIIHDLGQMLC